MDQKNGNSARLVLKHFVNNLRELNKVNVANRQFFTQAQMSELGPLISRCLLLVTELRTTHQQELVKSKKAYDMDEEDIERIKEEIAGVGKLSEQVMELCGQLCFIYKKDVLELVRDNAQTFFAQQLASFKNYTEEEVLTAVCFFSDFVDQTYKGTDANMICDLAAKFVEIMNYDKFVDSDSITQTCMHALGCFGYHL
jgi:hypothetical protein